MVQFLDLYNVQVNLHQQQQNQMPLALGVHQLFRAVQLLVDLGALTHLVAAVLRLELEPALEKIVQLMLSQTLQPVVPLDAELLVYGLQMELEYKLELSLVLMQIVKAIPKAKLGVPQKVLPLVEPVVVKKQLRKDVLQRQGPQTVQPAQLHLQENVHKSCLCYNIFMTDENLTTEESPRPERVFALMADGEVFHKWHIDEDYNNPYIAALIYGLQSGPTIIDITDENHEEINFGSTYENGIFTPPVE
jgi:hypothetical protein